MAKSLDDLRIEVVDDDMARVLRAKTGAERLKIASDLFASARRMIASHLAAEHPDWDEERIQRDAPPRDGWRSSAGRRRTGRWQSSDARLLSSPAGRGPCRRPRPRSAGHPGIWPWSLW